MIGKQLKELRKEANLTQEQLADILNITHHAISSYERNITSPSDETKIAIANYFKVSVDYLLGITKVKAAYRDDAYLFRVPITIDKQTLNEIKRYVNYIIDSESKK